MVARYEYKEEGNKVELKDLVMDETYYGELYEMNGKTYVKSKRSLDMNMISKFRKGIIK